MSIAPDPLIPANAGLILPKPQAKRQPKPKRKRCIADKFSERELRFVELILQGVDKANRVPASNEATRHSPTMENEPPGRIVGLSYMCFVRIVLDDGASRK